MAAPLGSLELMKRIKQVILIRKDLKMRRGKEIAQGSHASMEFIVRQLRDQGVVELDQITLQWISNGAAKVCLQVSSEEDLVLFHQKALEAGLQSNLIRDSGRTEFGGVPTLTSCGIGPNYEDDIDQITGGLSLY